MIKLGGSARPSPPWWQRFLVGRRPAWTLVRILVLVGVVLFLFRVMLVPVRVQGISMLPSYHEGQVNLINAWAYRWSPPRRGDVVAIRFSVSRVLLLKRIIGLPGERISFRGGQVLINGRPLNEPYLNRKRAPWNIPETTLPVDTYYVVGDNRSMAEEDHLKGTYHVSEILGKALF